MNNDESEWEEEKNMETNIITLLELKIYYFVAF